MQLYAVNFIPLLNSYLQILLYQMAALVLYSFLLKFLNW